MNNCKRGAVVAAVLMAVGAAGTAQAALVNRGGGMIYDTVNNITWLADMNYAFTSGYVANGDAPNGSNGTNAIWRDGRMGWAAAQQWADSLVYAGYSDWRLPTLDGSDASCSNSFDPGNGFPIQHAGGNCTGGELSHLFVADFGNQPGQSVWSSAGDTAQQMANFLLFNNVQDDLYWSGSSYVPSPAAKWVFMAYSGIQERVSVDGAPMYAVAVRAGDVVATVPEPQTLVLVLTMLAAAAAVRRGARTARASDSIDPAGQGGR